jgi:hypothetical protein
MNVPASNLPSKLVHATLSRARSAVNAVAWTPGWCPYIQNLLVTRTVIFYVLSSFNKYLFADGRRCIIGAGNGELSRWDAATFAFESAMQVSVFDICQCVVAWFGGIEDCVELCLQQLLVLSARVIIVRIC